MLQISVSHEAEGLLRLGQRLQVWQQEASEMLAKMEGVVELKALESLVSQASKLPVSLPDAKVTPCPTSQICQLVLDRTNMGTAATASLSACLLSGKRKPSKNFQATSTGPS